jgi:hypothetical protein
MGDPHGMQGGGDLVPPMVQEVEQHWKIGREIIFLPDKELQERRRVR